MSLIKISIILCFIRQSLQMVELYREKTIPVDQLSCVNTALRTYLVNNRGTGVFLTYPNSPLNSFLRVPSMIFTRWDSLREGFSVDTKAVVIFLEGNADKDLNGCMERLQDIDIVPPVLVVCITDVICSSDEYMKRIAKMVDSPELHYVALNKRGVIDIYGHTTTAEGSCGIPQLLKLGQCSDKLTAKKIFETSENFHGCPIRVATWPYPAYSELDNSNEYNQLSGSEGNVVQIVAGKVNATPILLLARNPEGVRQLVSDGKADLGFGRLDIRPVKGATYSNPYVFVQATVVAPHSMWSLGQLSGNILQPLEYKVWFGICVTIASILILRRLVPRLQKISVLQLFGVFLGVPVPRQPREVSRRIYFLSLVLFGYLCSQAYLTNLTKVLTTPHFKRITTLDNLERSSLRVSGPADSREKFRDDYPRIYSDFQVEDFLQYHNNTLKLLQEGRSSSAYYVEETDTRISEWKMVEAVHDRFNWYYVALAVSSTNSILKIGNGVLSRVFESGILNVYGIFSPKLHRIPKFRASTSFAKSIRLQLRELKAVFLLLIVGLSLSFLVFFLETMTSFTSKKKQGVTSEKCEH